MSQYQDLVRRRLTQALSLSERTIRSLVAVFAGASTLLTETLFPEALRKTTTYKVTIGLVQRYMIEQIAGMKEETAGELASHNDAFVQRKLAGTALDAAGLLAMGYSPLWVFAIAGDAAGGSRVYLNRLVTHLKANGLMAEEAEVKELADVLDAVQDATNRSAKAMDMPPLSRQELSALANELKAGYANAFAETADLIPRLDAIWERMEQMARRENISIKRLGGLMTVDALNWSRKSAGMVRAAGQTGAELFDEKILDSYRKTLATASEQGVDQYIGSHMKPFLQAAKTHFDFSQATWIESKLGNRSAGSTS